jgi:RNA polymerase sigma-70 factor (ECF subfamily)
METPTQTALVLAAQAGDQRAFETLVAAYRRELLVHCYRMLGSLHDAEDLVQETSLRAWEKRMSLTSPGSYRAWLYRIATNLCLDRLRSAPRRSLPPQTHPASNPNSPLPKPAREPIWLEPFPDDLLADHHSDPEDRALSRERTTLAFLVALQHLTPVQRAVLLLREVLSWEAREVAEWLNLSVGAVNSALERARRALQQRNVGSEEKLALPRPQLQNLLDRYVALWEQADIPGLVELLREDAIFTMPPFPVWFQGRAAIAALFQSPLFQASRQRHLIQTRANGSPAFGLYQWEPRRASISFLVWWFWMWWASRLPISQHFSISQASQPLLSRLLFRPRSRRAKASMISPSQSTRPHPPERSIDDGSTCSIHNRTGQGCCPIRGQKSSQPCRVGNSRGATQKRRLLNRGHDLLFRDPQRVGDILNRLLDGSGLQYARGTKANHSDSRRRKIHRKTSQERFHGPKGRANGRAVGHSPSRGRGDKEDDPCLLLDHVSAGGTRGDELRGKQSG